MAEFATPGIGRESNHVTLTAEFGDNASGVLYALGGAGGGMALYIDKGELVYVQHDDHRYIARSPDKIRLANTRSKIAKPRRTADVVLSVDGAEVARTTVQRNVAGAFTASESFDVGIDLGSPVSLDYFDRAPFPFNGKIENMTVKLS
jgi:hypothetical protein